MIDESLKSQHIRSISRFVLLARLALTVPGCNWIERISVNTSGDQGDDNSFAPVLSYSALYIAFSSEASNLVPGDSGEHRDVFLHDTVNATTIHVSIDSAGNEGDARSQYPAISADGRYVALGEFPPTSATSHLPVVRPTLLVMTPTANGMCFCGPYRR